MVLNPFSTGTHFYNEICVLLDHFLLTLAWVYGGQKINGHSLHYFNPFSTGTHFYLEIFVPLDHFINIRKGVWRAQD
ncbi:hypothetical protein E2C01_088417 [Portunus trituberculatus]|uniref:Uncharacterized protein n=1 Tax=Portunus trituberculatus TaxID=210409 RepID=A0A5B7JAP8_PORTR|nr:hypothetical protein [Portunus trituberculatus]